MQASQNSIRGCRDAEQNTILAIVNAAAERYRGIIPADCWHEPYMSARQLQRDIDAGVTFWGCEESDGQLVGRDGSPGGEGRTPDSPRLRADRPAGKGDWRRVVGVTVALSLVGAFCGAVLGGLALVIDLMPGSGIQGVRPWAVAFLVGGVWGAFFGAVLAPIVAWLFLRRVSFGRAIVQTGAGILIGLIAGAIVAPGASFLFGLLGFVRRRVAASSSRDNESRFALHEAHLE